MLESIFLHVLNMSYVGGGVIAIVLVVRFFLKKFPKKYSYILWIVPLIRLVFPFSIESVISLIPFNPEPIPDTIMYDQMPIINTGISSIDGSINQMLPRSEIVGSVNQMQVWIFIGAIIWLLGILVLIAYGVASYVKLKRKLLDSNIEQENIFYSDSFDTPFVMGIIKPKIFLPSFLSEAEREYILLHEQIHINRRDHIVRFISYIVLSFHWFNPMVWIAFFMSEKDMEMSCDEAVLYQLGDTIKKEYSSSLLSMATGRGRLSMSPLAFGEGETKGRIKNIIRFNKPKAYIIAIALIIITVVSIGLLVNPKNSLSERDIRIATDEIKAEVMSINEDINGLDYEIIVTNNSSYTVYDLNLTLSYPIIIPNGSMTNLDGIEADHIIEKMESGSYELVRVFIPTDYSHGKNVDNKKPEVHFRGYIGELKDTNRIEYIGRIETISKNDGETGSLNSDTWIQEASSEPVQAVKAALLNQEAKDYTISMSIGSIDIDEEETQRVVDRYVGSELARSRGWSDDYLQEHFLVVKANYIVEYDHTKTFMPDGNLEQYFYLTEDIETGLWMIVDNTSANSLTIIEADPLDGNLDFAIRYTQLYGYEEFIILSSTQESLTILAYHGNDQTLTAATLESAVITIDKTMNDSVKEEIFLNEELTGYVFTPHNRDASYQNYIVGIRYRLINTNPSTLESAIVIIPKSDLSALSVYESFEQAEQSQGLIPTIIDMTLNVQGQYLSYQDIDEYYKVYDILNGSLYSVEDQLDHLSVDYSNFIRHITGTINDYRLPIIYLITSANGEDLVFNTATLEFESLNDKDNRIVVSKDNHYTAMLSRVDEMQQLELIDREGNTIFSYGYHEFLTEIKGTDFSELQWQLLGFDESSSILWGGFGGDLDTVAHFIYKIESDEFILFDQSNNDAFIEYLNKYPAVR
ncbi:MAG TPA: M56 family metallopeptidase [Clostridia bacterium]|nr:M56 family metallopeptidase [Clostridia bacterium]